MYVGSMCLSVCVCWAEQSAKNKESSPSGPDLALVRAVPDL